MMCCEKRIPKHGDENEHNHAHNHPEEYEVKKESPNMGTKTSIFPILEYSYFVKKESPNMGTKTSIIMPIIIPKNMR